ncbi:response regulator transcription factor [Pseudomonas fluorescens]|uniref:DNA-binding response regulator n=1 Tax=Pseudomonas fluorescens TaxID=294 RepID=A0A423LGI9_PSEFL|nr:response regulator transcription factor [Pseudomonas fluorescens]RON67395.1 DNA-binding response regulator [Pseudomonas fluorescens]
MSIRIALVDDHNLIRAGLRALLEEKGYAVVAEACDGEEVDALLARCQVDVLLMDIEMKCLSGLDALKRLRVQWPELPVILLSMHDTRDLVVEAMKAGVSGYLLKDAVDVELRLALEAVMEGHRYLSLKASNRILEALETSHSTPPKEVLTQRQREVLYWLALGKANKEVAHLLSISTKTVDAHRAQLMERLGIHDLAGLVVYAIRNGIIELKE